MLLRMVGQIKVSGEVKKVTKVKIENTLASEAIVQETETTVNRYVTGLKEKKIKVLKRHLISLHHSLEHYAIL